jgi:hypothetical protein
MRRTRSRSEFSTATRRYFDRLPELPGLDAGTARRVLTTAYADVLAARDGFSREAGPAAPEVISFLRRLAALLRRTPFFLTVSAPTSAVGQPSLLRSRSALLKAASTTETTRTMQFLLSKRTT